MRNEINLTDDQINEVFASEWPQKGFDMDECRMTDRGGVEFTRDTMDQFLVARKSWEKPGDMFESTTEVGGFRYFEIEDAQALRGQAKCNVLVVDFGPVRVVYK